MRTYLWRKKRFILFITCAHLAWWGGKRVNLSQNIARSVHLSCCYSIFGTSSNWELTVLAPGTPPRNRHPRLFKSVRINNITTCSGSQPRTCGGVYSSYPKPCTVLVDFLLCPPVPLSGILVKISLRQCLKEPPLFCSSQLDHHVYFGVWERKSHGHGVCWGNVCASGRSSSWWAPTLTLLSKLYPTKVFAPRLGHNAAGAILL